jgi:hypothetical protein
VDGTRLATDQNGLLVQELYKQRVEVKTVMGPGNPGFYQPTSIKALGKLAVCLPLQFLRPVPCIV